MCKHLSHSVPPELTSLEAGLAFSIIVLLAMLLGVAAAVWHSWLAPYFLRRRLAARANVDPEKASPTPMLVDEKALSTPDLKDITTPHNSPTSGDPAPSRTTLALAEDGSTLAASLSKLANDDEIIVKPRATYYPDNKRVRLSANAPERDLPWWFF